jgi:signal transduction histidine kinase
MDATTASPSVAPRPGALHGVGWAGIGLVAVVVVVYSFNTTAKFLATEPLAVWLEIFIFDVVYHAIIGLAILAAAVLARHQVPSRGVTQYVVAAVAVVLATALALVAIEATSDGGIFDEPGPDLAARVWFLATEVFRYSFVGVVITSAWLYLCAEAEHAAAVEQCAIDAERMDRETAEARLQMLEAQIEPHFLFNTLAHVRRLYETDRDAGVRMLHNLRDYLSIALPRMRDGAATLGREIDHVASYLDIQHIRMGHRLAYAIDVPDALRDARLPPLMVLTLVENAVKHGLTPLPEGGHIDVRATATGTRLRIDVVDTGRGFAKSQGSGTGLANIRARLASAYGPSARLSLALGPAGGVIATLELPLEVVSPGSVRT